MVEEIVMGGAMRVFAVRRVIGKFLMAMMASRRGGRPNRYVTRRGDVPQQ